MIPIADRPQFARRLVAVWRLHHLAAGDELTVNVSPGEWPDDGPQDVKGVRVHEWDALPPESVLVLGRVGEVWRVACNFAYAPTVPMSLDDLALTTAFLQVDDTDKIKLWLSPSPETGEVPMWEIQRKDRTC